MFDILARSGLGCADLVSLFLIFVAWPLAGELGKPRQNAVGDAPAIKPMDVYNSSMIFLWATAIIILVGWAFTRRPWNAIGFSFEWSPAMVGAFAVVAVISGYLLFELLRSFVSARSREKMRNEMARLKDAVHIIPRNAKEYRRAMMLAVTAGITEEIIFRGYLIWALSQFTHVWLAALIAVAHFVFLHRYQGWYGMKRVAVITAAVTLLFVLTNSLAPAIILHILVDVLMISRIAVSYRDETAAPAFR